MAEKKKPAPWEKPESSNPESTLFVGGASRPKQDESSILLLDSAKPYIAVTAGPKKGKQVTISSDKLVLGREPPADLIVDDKAASRRHAQVYKKGSKWWLRDLDSTNGTYLDGPLKGAERILWDGDVFKIGDWEFTFSDPKSKKK